jgi:hypothetical protein
MAYLSRTKVNATVSQLDGEITGINVPDLEQYKDPVDATALMDDLKKANEVNSKRDQLTADITRGTTAISDSDKAIAEMEKMLSVKKKDRERQAKKLADLQKELSATKPELTADLELKIKTASQHNANHETIRRYNDLKKRYDSAVEEAKSLTSKIGSLVDEKAQLVMDCGLPIDGLSFDENGLYINKLPLSEEQVATSVIMDLGVRIAVALNPKLKIIRIPRGESMGKKRLDDVIEFAKRNGYQLFIERVESGVDKLTIQFIEQ